ncbi:MAG: hypothetical protein ACOVNR_04795, partial [Chitinophagaceae bacterium]
MKKAIAYFLSLIYLFAATEASQLLKIPLLIKHYQNHQLEKKVSFIGFLKQHYVDAFEYDADYQQDLQLPFKTPVTATLLVSNALPHILHAYEIPECASFVVKMEFSHHYLF